MLEGELVFRYADGSEVAGPGPTAFVPAGKAHTYEARLGARYLVVLTPRVRALISALHADRDPGRQMEIYPRFDS